MATTKTYTRGVAVLCRCRGGYPLCKLSRGMQAPRVRPRLSARSAPEIGHDPFCPQCGYSLRGLNPRDSAAAEVCCPECGFAVDLRTLQQSIIPWVHRREIGRWRAYW